jgi:hypothetical protein
MPRLCCLVHGSVMARREMVQLVGGYRPELEPAEDYDLWLRLLPLCGFARIAEALYDYRVHSGQSSTTRKRRQLEQTIAAKLHYLRRTVPDLPTRARLAISGHGAGADVYRRMGREIGFDVVPCPTDLEAECVESGLAAPRTPSACDEWDVLVVTDFAAIDRYERHLRSTCEAITASGNFFVRGVAASPR